MIIVSQIKEMIVNFDNICALGINKKNPKEILSTTNNGNTQTLGTYETDSRAKEVLKEIKTAYSNFTYFKNATKEGKDYIINLLKHKYEQFDIYEMPKE